MIIKREHIRTWQLPKDLPAHHPLQPSQGSQGLELYLNVGRGRLLDYQGFDGGHYH